MTEFHTPPRPHQAADFERAKRHHSWGHLWEMGCGKSWMGINQAAHLYRRGQIDALLVVAPPSVHENWVSDEIPKHMPPDVPWSGHVYHSSRARTKTFQRELRAMFDEPFPVLVMTYQAFRTKRGKRDGPRVLLGQDLALKFLKKRRCLYCLDESQRIKTPGTQITKKIIASAKYADHRRIFSGTSVTNSPFDVYSQIRFLDPTFWPRHGFASYHAFKTTFGVFKEVQYQRVDERGRAREQTFQKLLYFRNLDYLKQLVREICDRHTTDEVLELPSRTFSRRYFDPTPEQRRMYKSLKEDFYAFIDGEEEMITAQRAMTRLIRFQQILSGFVERDAMEGGGTILLKDNPRLACLLDFLENDVETGEKVIIWARFKHDISRICEKLGEAAVRFDGEVKDTDRLAARRRFQNDPECRYFVANPAAGGTGLTLNEARTVVYYSNSFDLEHRLQSQARNYRIGQTGTVRVVDLVCRGLGIDSHLLSRLKMKYQMMSKVMGDELKSWI